MSRYIEIMNKHNIEKTNERLHDFRMTMDEIVNNDYTQNTFGHSFGISFS